MSPSGKPCRRLDALRRAFDHIALAQPADHQAGEAARALGQARPSVAVVPVERHVPAAWVVSVRVRDEHARRPERDVRVPFEAFRAPFLVAQPVARSEDVRFADLTGAESLRHVAERL